MRLQLNFLPTTLHSTHIPSSLQNSLLPLIPHRLASHAAQATGNQKKNGPGKRLGAKKASTELVVPGNIIFRQRGTHWFPGDGCGMGRDHTIFAREKGYVVYYSSNLIQRKGRKYIGIVAERGMKLPREPTQPRRRLLNLVSRRFDKGETQRAAAAEAAEAATVAELAAGTTTAADRLPGTNGLRMLGRRQYLRRETNWDIGRVTDGMNIKITPFRKTKRRVKKRRKTLVWKRLGRGRRVD